VNTVSVISAILGEYSAYRRECRIHYLFHLFQSRTVEFFANYYVLSIEVFHGPYGVILLMMFLPLSSLRV
jgi:hypothetical protein